MKKTLSTALFVLMITNISLAQSYDLDWGTEAQVGSPTASYAPIGIYKGDYYTVQFDKGDGTLIKVGKDYDVTTQKELVATDKKFEAEFMFRSGDKIVFINSDFDSKTKSISITATNYDFNGKLLTPKPKLLTTIKVERNNENNDLFYRLSQDSTKLLIVEDHNMPDKEDSKFSIAVIGTSDLKEIWASSYTAPYEDRDFTLLSNAVDNNGNVLLLSLIKGGEGKRLAKYSTRMFTIDAQSKKYLDRELKIEDKYISSAFIQFANDNKLLITGFYNKITEKGKNEGIEGAFICTTDMASLENPDLRMRKLDPSTKAAITPTGGLAKLFDADELNGYFIREINIRKDGSGYVIAEQRFITYDIEGNTETRTYHFNHLIVYNFDANQDITYISTIPKYQISSYAAPRILGITFWTGAMTRYCYKYNSFEAIEKNNTIYILYNDHRDNGDARSLKEAKVMSNKNKANAVIVAVDPNGKWDKEALFVGKDIDVILETSSSYLIQGEAFIISAERKKNVQFAKITVK